MTVHWHDSDAAAQYVAATLPADMLDAFEEHLLACERCRSEVRTGAATRVALGAAHVEAGARAQAVPAMPLRARRATVAGIAAAAAAAILLFVIVNRDSSFQELGAITPPPFVGGALRAPADSATDLVDHGMAAYAAGDYSTAASWLTRATPVDSSAGVAFYLGVSLLMIDENARALAALTRARQPAGNAYADEALLFAVKALVRERQTDSALALIRIAPRDGPVAVRLHALGDSIGRR